MPSLLIPEFQFLYAMMEDGTLERQIHESLVPNLQFRALCDPIESWAAEIGTKQIFIKKGLLPIDTRPRVPGMDPLPSTAPMENWIAEAFPLNQSVNVDMPTSRAAVGDWYDQSLQSIVVNAAITMNRACRNRLFASYNAGHAIADSAGSTQTTITVTSIAGFQYQIQSDGKLEPVGVNNPKPFYINDVLQAVRVIGAAAEDPNFPLGRGTLTVESPGVTVALNDAIRAHDASLVVRSGGGLSVDALSSGDLLTMADIRTTLARMRRHGVPPHADGLYHVELDPIGESQLFLDAEFRQAAQGQIGNDMYGQFVVNQLLGCRFYRNNDCPTEANVMALQATRPVNEAAARGSSDFGGELINDAGVRVIRTLVTGGRPVCEKYIPHNEYLTSLGVEGVQQFGSISVTNNGIQITVDRIQILMRPPQNNLQNKVTITWAWSGDFPVPSDYWGGTDRTRFKRGAVIESAGPPA